MTLFAFNLCNLFLSSDQTSLADADAAHFVGKFIKKTTKTLKQQGTYASDLSVILSGNIGNFRAKSLDTFLTLMLERVRRVIYVPSYLELAGLDIDEIDYYVNDHFSTKFGSLVQVLYRKTVEIEGVVVSGASTLLDYSQFNWFELQSFYYYPLWDVQGPNPITLGYYVVNESLLDREFWSSRKVREDVWITGSGFYPDQKFCCDTRHQSDLFTKAASAKSPRYLYTNNIYTPTRDCLPLMKQCPANRTEIVSNSIKSFNPKTYSLESTFKAFYKDCQWIV